MTLTTREAQSRHWDFMHGIVKPEDVCGLNYNEPGGGLGTHHFCVDKPGHKGKCTCHCGFHWPKEKGVKP